MAETKLPMTWTKEIPDIPGLYLYEMVNTQTGHTVEIKPLDITLQQIQEPGFLEKKTFANFYDVYWLGPLPPKNGWSGRTKKKDK